MSDTDNAETRAREESADEVFRAWERLRIVYNVVLGIGIIPFIQKVNVDRRWIRLIIAYAAISNLCFSAGPVMEGYAKALGIERHVARKTIFLCGLIISVICEFSVMTLRTLEDLD